MSDESTIHLVATVRNKNVESDAIQYEYMGIREALRDKVNYGKGCMDLDYVKTT
jgi:hypothetical protein